MWGSEVANSKTEIHLTNTPSELTWACDVTTINREGDYFARHMLLRLVEVVRQSYKRPEARNTLRIRLVVWSTAVLTYLSVLLFSHCYYLVHDYTPCFLPICARHTCDTQCASVGVASWGNGKCRQRQTAEVGCCCRSDINSNKKVRDHRTGSSHSGADEYPRGKTRTNQMWYKHISKLTQFMPPPETYKQ